MMNLRVLFFSKNQLVGRPISPRIDQFLRTYGELQVGGFPLEITPSGSDQLSCYIKPRNTYI